MGTFETKIGPVRVIAPVVLAPMAGVTDLAFRLIAKSFGAALVYIPLISAKALCLGSQKTLDLLASDPAERPVAVQIFGSNPDTIADAVRLLNAYPVDIIDINMGCPVPKVAGNEAGASLLRDPKLATRIVRAAVSAATLPVTVKLRSGWDENSINVLEVARRVEEAGASAVAVHPRTRSQGFTGCADWDLIAQVKKNVKIPVIGNGDICRPEDVEKMLELTGCDLAMIARAARGNPWIFSRTKSLLHSGILPPEPSAGERLRILARHCTLLSNIEDSGRAALKMRKHAAWYIRGLKNAAATRDKINHARTIYEIIEISEGLEKEWHKSCSISEGGNSLLTQSYNCPDRQKESQ